MEVAPSLAKIKEYYRFSYQLYRLALMCELWRFDMEAL